MRRQKGAKCSSATHSTTVDSARSKTGTFRAAQARQYDGEPAELHGFHRYICYVGRGRLHSDEAPEPQQTLFSWAEFMAEEPVKPKGRSRKTQPAATSLFDWALSLEQEREKEPVGAGR